MFTSRFNKFTVYSVTVSSRITCENKYDEVEFIESVINLVGNREISGPERGDQ